MRGELRAEWTKLRTVRSTVWSLLAIPALTVGVGLLLVSGSSSSGGPGAGDNDLVRDSLVGIYLAEFAVVAFAVVAITSEYATGLIHTTFTALPRRGRVLAAKAALVGAGVFTDVQTCEASTASNPDGHGDRGGRLRARARSGRRALGRCRALRGRRAPRRRTCVHLQSRSAVRRAADYSRRGLPGIERKLRAGYPRAH